MITTTTHTDSVVTQKVFSTPQIVSLGKVTAMTGHCSSGCDHDSMLHPNEFKEKV